MVFGSTTEGFAQQLGQPQYNFKDCTVFITGATRGIGLAIGKRLAREGANIVVVGKTREPHPKLPGTVRSACAEIEALGARALGIVCDIRDDAQIEAAVEEAAAHFSGIDILINNASAIFLANTDQTTPKRFDLMHQVNARGTFMTTRACLPHLRKSERPHVLTLSPPLDLKAQYFGPHVGYSIAKFSMSLCTLGFAEELRSAKIAVNSLWPKTIIDTSAVRNLLGGESTAKRGRSAEIVADAAHLILGQGPSFTGQFVIDEDILRASGIDDLSRYSECNEEDLIYDLFVPESLPS
jgi:citronellol/citronellal dehydrogenase